MWTPRGYIFVDGYWDYPVGRRGMLFAPVYFNSGLYSRRGYNYSPSIVLDLALFAEHLFLRPNYHHYYFGDYYDVGYRRQPPQACSDATLFRSQEDGFQTSTWSTLIPGCQCEPESTSKDDRAEDGSSKNPCL
jgi:hypothetical protein